MWVALLLLHSLTQSPMTLELRKHPQNMPWDFKVNAWGAVGQARVLPLSYIPRSNAYMQHLYIILDTVVGPFHVSISSFFFFKVDWSLNSGLCAYKASHSIT
jgi:hypothetical protein